MQPNDQLVAALRRWTQVFMRRSTRDFVLYSKKSGYSMAQVGALFRIDRGEVTVSDLGGELGVTNAAASQMLDRLVHLQLILRTEDLEDRRIKRLALTAKGRKVMQEAMQVRQRWMENLAGSLSEREKEQVTAALNILAAKAEELDAIAEPKG
jgi:DNA-binding MarR family transcriptional regulator